MTYFLVFLLCCSIEVLYARWAIAVQARNAPLAGLFAATLQIPVLIGLYTIVVSGWYIIPNILGHGVGSWAAVKWSKGGKNQGQDRPGEEAPKDGGRLCRHGSSCILGSSTCGFV